MLFFANLSGGVELDADKPLHDWQVQRRMEPAPCDLEKEHKCYVYINDGLTEREVDTALNTQFPFIQNMMFVGTVKTYTANSISWHSQDHMIPVEVASLSALYVDLKT